MKQRRRARRRYRAHQGEPSQTVLNRALHAIRRVVEDQVVRRRREGKILLGVILPRRFKQLPHLGREDIVVAVLVWRKLPNRRSHRPRPYQSFSVMSANSLPSGTPPRPKRTGGL
jgi:hypothetical protein